MCPTETESGLKQSHNVRSSSLSDTRADEVAHSPGDALTHSRGKSKTHSSVSRHLSTRISDRPIDAFVSFYPSDTAAVLPACPIWYLSVFFSFVSLTIRPHCAARILPISFFPRSCRFIPPFHSCVDGGELARRKAARGGGTWRTPRFIPWTAR